MPQWIKQFKYRELRIRFARGGFKHHPFFKMYVAKHYQARQAMPIDVVGSFNPVTQKDGNKHVQMNIDRMKYWLSVGAKPTRPVERILTQMGLLPSRPSLPPPPNHADLLRQWRIQKGIEKPAEKT